MGASLDFATGAGFELAASTVFVDVDVIVGTTPAGIPTLPSQLARLGEGRDATLTPHGYRTFFDRSETRRPPEQRFFQ